MSKINTAECHLAMSLETLSHRVNNLRESKGQRFYSWVGSELERLAGESYNIADEIGDDTGANPSLDGPLPGFDPDPHTCKQGSTFCNACYYEIQRDSKGDRNV